MVEGVAALDVADLTRPLPAYSRIPMPSKPYGDTGVRLELFSESIEMAELEHDFETALLIRASDTERDCQGFRASFGDSVGGFVQIFVEEFRTAALPTNFNHIGVGGGVAGHPEIATIDEVALIIPFRVEFDIAVGIEDLNGYD